MTFGVCGNDFDLISCYLTLGHLFLFEKNNPNKQTVKAMKTAVMFAFEQNFSFKK